jgi:hypothetical protein
MGLRCCMVVASWEGDTILGSVHMGSTGVGKLLPRVGGAKWKREATLGQVCV